MEQELCPVCNSEKVEGGFIEVDGKEAYQEMRCLACDSDWETVYMRSYRRAIVDNSSEGE
jgi:formate dehydrogenase maturation protein FdhE